MKVLLQTLLVGTGGFLGANLRYWLGGWIQGRLDEGFPWHTFFINVTGSFVISLFLGLSTALNWHPNWRLFLAIGILGGYTTFSSFSWEALALMTGKLYGQALGYVLGSVILSIIGAWLGLLLAGRILGPQS
ncbi:fluoride efflux transporter CrcB [Fimbriimonas ginsengisoli]|uniref:Fluoride-specific ion channel FluC n=1 Tax=Fimbriimonas ginsengisoli Gsoil 348 TaxID=661478 RepID=A0A068NP09_FIMGI|nr:fluoride efflux transporter CrcB [Fimbriimonas ginsengisoli]AIE85298.1 Protein CrcB [Fimbriimonas ginsengisoli Gsoil 348]